MPRDRRTPAPEDEAALQRALKTQKKLSWDIEKDFDWSGGADLSRYFVPLDSDNLVFPEATPSQRLAISQFLGLVIAQTFAEMETVLVSAKELVWRRHLKLYPVNPEFEQLGEQFFDEEEKHARMFRRYLAVFAKQTGIDEEELRQILPTVTGSVLHRALKLNSQWGGHALWWVLTLVEEVSIHIFKQMQPHRARLDPLYYSLHRRHFEEEVRHSPYSYWMLEHLHKRDKRLASLFFRKTDLLLAQSLETAWTLSSLSRIRSAVWLRKKHPFYAELASCLPQLIRLGPIEVIRRLFVSAPFVSLMLNFHHHRDYEGLIAKLRAVHLPTPLPRTAPLAADE